MKVKVFCLVMELLAITSHSTGAVVTDYPKLSNVTSESQDIKYSSHEPINYRSEEFINQHSENLRNVIASEQRKHEQIKKEKAIVTVEEERFPSLEELRIKCQHFSRLFGLNQYGSSTAEPYVDSDSVIIDRPSSTMVPERYEYHQNQPVIEVTRRPVFIRNKPTFIQKSPAGFYVTASPLGNSGNEATTTKRPFWITSTHFPRVSYTSRFTTSTTTPSTTITTKQTTVPNTTEATATTTPTKPKIKIKYTKFEPVILQKTILTDGRVMYHWHRSLPTSALDLTAPVTLEYPPAAQRNVAGLVDGNTLDSAGTTSTTTSTTTTEKSSWLFVPFSSFFGSSHDEETTTTAESATSPLATSSIAPSTKVPEISSTTPNTAAYSDTEVVKPAQLKLVVPIHYDDLDSSLSPQRPNSMTKPASPSLEVIKTVGVPQNVPRYSLGYTGTGYGLTYANGMGYGAYYGSGYLNHQGYKHGV